MTQKQPLMTLAGCLQTYVDDFIPYAAKISPPNMRYYIWGRQIAASIPASHRPTTFSADNVFNSWRRNVLMPDIPVKKEKKIPPRVADPKAPARVI